MAIILDGKSLAKKIRGQVALQAEECAADGHRPGLAVILVGEDPASQIYVRNKEKACDSCGIRSEKILFPEDVPEEVLLERIRALNADDSIDGVLVQLPLPAGFNRLRVLETIAPEKDVDGLLPVSAGLLAAGRAPIAPCTPSGIMEILKEYGIDPTGKNCCVIGRSELVGRPMVSLLSSANGTVTLCHSRTKDLAAETRRADILVAAVGRPELIKGDMIKPGAAVIDVGINRLADGTLRGDVEFSSAQDVAGWITPVPGGVGPMTIAMLMKNTLTLHLLHQSK